MDVCSCGWVFCVRGQHGFLQYFTILCIGSFIGSPTGWCVPSPCVQGSNTTCSSDFITPTTSMWVSGLCVHVCCMCIGRRGCVCIFVHDRYWYSILLPMVSVGSPTGWCVPRSCVHGSESTLPSAFFCCTASTDDTTWISANTGLCVVWVGICLRTSELL